MTPDSFQWLPFLTFAVVSSITPGPNVVMLASSGSRWGYRKTLPHLVGICFGFPLMLLIIQFSAGKVFSEFPWLYPALTVISLTYILWIAIWIFRMGFHDGLKIKSGLRPMRFHEAVLFQWVNGKAWQMAITIATIYASDNAWIKILGSLSFVVIILTTGSMWIELGKRIAVYLGKASVRKTYYSTLALALLLSTWPQGLSQLFGTR